MPVKLRHKSRGVPSERYDGAIESNLLWRSQRAAFNFMMSAKWIGRKGEKWCGVW